MAIDNAAVTPPLFGVSPTKRWESSLTSRRKKLMARLRQRASLKGKTRSYFTTMASTRRDVKMGRAWCTVSSVMVHHNFRGCSCIPATANVTRLREMSVDSTRDSCLASARHGLEFPTFCRGMIAAIGALQICLRLFVKGNGNMNCVLKKKLR